MSVCIRPSKKCGFPRKGTDGPGFELFQQSQGATLIPDALENLAKSTVRNRGKVSRPFSHSKKIRSTMRILSRQDRDQAEVADYQVELTDEGTGFDFICQGNLGPADQASKTAFCREKPANLTN